MQYENDNPFNLVYNACWELARQNEVLSRHIYLGNQIDYMDNLDPKTEISDADLPELELTTNSFTNILKSSSSSCRVVKRYSWILVTGDFRLTDLYNEIMWELFALMSNWDRFLCGNVIWKGKDFIKEVRGLAGTEGTEFVDENRNIRGWASIWPFEIDMIFLVSDLREIVDGNTIGE